jgi:hypothetical protein
MIITGAIIARGAILVVYWNGFRLKQIKRGKKVMEMIF